MHQPRFRRHVPLLAAATLALAACSEAAPPAPTAVDAHAAHTRRGSYEPTQGHRNMARQVLAAVQQYHDEAAAQAGGYSVQFPAGCAELPGTGAQGFHWVNPELADDNHVNLLTPELLMYERRPDGSSVLVGVDYVIPFSAWKSKHPPVLMGVPFMRNDGLEVWALHIWAPRENPLGLFAAWNPNVTCPAAG